MRTAAAQAAEVRAIDQSTRAPSSAAGDAMLTKPLPLKGQSG